MTGVRDQATGIGPILASVVLRVGVLGAVQHGPERVCVRNLGCKQQKQTLADLKQGDILTGWGHSQNQETAEKEAGRVGNNDSHDILEQELINQLVRGLLRAQCYLSFSHFG